MLSCCWEGTPARVCDDEDSFAVVDGVPEFTWLDVCQRLAIIFGIYNLDGEIIYFYITGQHYYLYGNDY